MAKQSGDVMAIGDMKATFLDSSTVIETPNGIVRWWPDGNGGVTVVVAKAAPEVLCYRGGQ